MLLRPGSSWGFGCLAQGSPLSNAIEGGRLFVAEKDHFQVAVYGNHGIKKKNQLVILSFEFISHTPGFFPLSEWTNSLLLS